MSTPKHQVRYQLVKQPQGYALQRRDAEPVRTPSDGEVLVRVRACSLNRRDVMVKKGFYPIGAKETLVPLSDGAGEVVAVGRGVTRFKEGDRAAAIFSRIGFPDVPRRRLVRRRSAVRSTVCSRNTSRYPLTVSCPYPKKCLSTKRHRCRALP